MKSNQFAVVIPLYNRAPTILRALHSVLCQKYQPSEIVIVDDGSTDDGASVVATMADSRILLISQKNSGVSRARNVGVLNTSSQYLTFLDADDTWEPEYLERQNKLINIYPDMGAYSTGYYLKYPNENLMQAPIRCVPSVTGVLDNYFKAAAAGSNPMLTHCSCIPRHIFNEMGGFPDKVRLHEDLFLWSKIALQYPIAHASEPLATYYKYEEGSVCLNLVVEERDLVFFNLLEDIILEKRVSVETLDYVSKYLNQWLVRDAVKAGCAGDFSMAKKCISRYQVTSFQERVWRAVLSQYVVIPAGAQRIARSIGRRLKAYSR
ncbi:MAG: glycosyltransferase family 2 protein [Proteobacteria bacterium]|nr:glycosyltransferase family 2 protein [Pseudomonadota bacterium]